MPDRPNFYVLLDLDPSVREWSPIEERIRAKRDEWARQRCQGHPKARVRAEQCQHYLPEIEACLKDRVCRAREAEEAERILATERRRHEAELDELVELIRSGGGACDRERLDRLAQKFEGVLTRQQIEARLRSAGVEIEEDEEAAAGTEEEPAELDRQVAREIRRRLDLLGLRDLYEFLGLPAGSRPEALRARAAQVYPENRRLGRHDGVATAQNDLASYCEPVFATEATKAAYDRYLTVEVMERLGERIELAGADGLLTREEMDALVRKAAELGVHEAAARAYLESVARERGWKIDHGATPRPEPAATPTASTHRDEGRRASSLAFLVPYLRALARRPAIAVPAGLTALGMATVLAASLGAPGAYAPPVASLGPPPPPAAASSPPQPAASSSAASATRAAPPARSGAVPVPTPGPWGGGGDQGAPGTSVTPSAASSAPAADPPRPPSPPALPTLPVDPRLVLVAVGDEQIGPLVEETVGSALRGAGFEVDDNRGSLALANLLRSSRGHPPLSEMARALAADGFDVLVLAEIDPVGHRRLEFYGRTELATTSRVRLHAYALIDQRALGSGWSGQVEYTERGTAQQVAKAVEPAGAALAQEITRGWAGKLAAIQNGR